MATDIWTTVHPIPWRNTSFLYLPWWIHNILIKAKEEGKDWREYADPQYALQIDTLKQAYVDYGEVNFIESKNGYQYTLSEYTVDGPDPQPPLGPMLQPVAVMSNPPTQKLLKGVGLSGTATIVSGGTGYVFGDIVDIPGAEGDVPGQIRVTAVGSNGEITTAQIRKPGVYATAPTGEISATGGTGTGAKFTVTTNAGVASTIYAGVTIARTDSKITYWGSDIKDAVAGFRGNGTGNGTQCRVNFKTDSSKIDFKLAGNNSKYDLYVDGQRISATSVTTDSSGAVYIYSIDWNGVEQMREYSLVGVNTAFGGIYVDTGKTITAITRPAKMIWQLGDSYTFGTMATQASFNDFRFYCDKLGLVGLADGIGGSGWTSTNSTQPQARITAKLATLSFTPDIITLALGYNDAPAGRIDLLKTNFRESIALIKQYQPQAKIIVFGPATPLGMTDQIAAVRDALIELTTELDLEFVDVKGWVTAENANLYTSSDNVHPNDQGYFWRGSQFTNVLQGKV